MGILVESHHLEGDNGTYKHKTKHHMFTDTLADAPAYCPMTISMSIFGEDLVTGIVIATVVQDDLKESVGYVEF